ncbi:hypothetical protein [Sphingopyxis terrae]|uniref:hypothetical protein n=1 Tax=Sphingopyxis terrae TaxID=33052 RepID=UPI002A13B051|nr:hypothetical protein [Sphingopyxis terrae]MDX8358313.1 hypothetical protein [Sphingopyxis terrae]
MQLAQFIKDNRKISQFYTPFSGTYLLKSPTDLFDLQASFVGYFPPDLFVLAKVNPSEVAGWLNKDVWSWFNASHDNILAQLESASKGIGSGALFS